MPAPESVWPIRCIGIDLSTTSTGMACLYLSDSQRLNLKRAKITQPNHFHHENAEWRSLIGDGSDATETPRSNTKTIDRVIWCYNQIQALITSHQPHLVVIEGYSFNNRVHLPTVELAGLIKSALRRNATPFIVVPPATLKKAATGKGNAKKPDMIAASANFTDDGKPILNDDMADATHLAAFGLAWLHTCTIGNPILNLAPPDKLKTYTSAAINYRPGLESSVISPFDAIRHILFFAEQYDGMPYGSPH